MGGVGRRTVLRMERRPRLVRQLGRNTPFPPVDLLPRRFGARCPERQRSLDPRQTHLYYAGGATLGM